METAGVYARISLDRVGEGAGVERQVEDAVALAEGRGLVVVDRYVDNDRSAYSGKPRPEWTRLLEDLRSGRITTVVAWTNDRLYRRTRDQLDLLELVRVAGGAIITVKDGDVDPSSASGRMQMGLLANIAEFESARKAERVARAAEQRAASGRPHGRPSFGWKLVDGQWAIDRDQAALVREAAMRILRGESCGAIVADWNERGIPTAHGGPWRHQSLAKIMRRPANAARRIHRGEIVGQATWPPIIDMETFEAVVSRMSSGPAQRRARRYLLTTILRCGGCGERMVGARKDRDGYQCAGCARRIGSDRLDEFITDQVLEKLATPRLAERLARARNDKGEAKALKDFDRADRRLSELAEMFGAGDLEPAEYRVAREAAQAKRAAAERQLTSGRTSRVLGELLSGPDALRGTWDMQGVAWRREVISAVVERIEIGPSTKAAWEPGRVGIVWRSS